MGVRQGIVAFVCLLSCLSGCWQRTVVPSQAPEIRRPLQPELGTPAPDFTRELEIPPGMSLVPAEWTPLAQNRNWSSIVIHHTASNSGSVESIHEEHLKRKDGRGNPWMGVGYHFVIGNGNGMGDGVIEPTFRWREQLHGAHAGDSEYNQRGIGIVLVGNFEHNPPSPSQLSAVKRLVGYLKTTYDIPAEKVIGHRDVKTTACPGKMFPLSEVSRSGWGNHLGRTD